MSAPLAWSGSLNTLVISDLGRKWKGGYFCACVIKISKTARNNTRHDPGIARFPCGSTAFIVSLKWHPCRIRSYLVRVQGYVDARTTLVSNSNAMASYSNAADGRACVSTASFSADDTLNNDYFYDDEFAVPFDAHVAAARQLCRSLTDSCIDNDDVAFDEDRQRPGRLTLSRSESCLYRSAADSQGDEMMSTSERAGDFLMSSSDLSDLDANHRPLFSPVPPDSEAVSGGEGAQRGGEESASRLDESGEGGVRMRCAMYDATSAKRQYRLSFADRSTPTRTSSSAEDCARWTSTKTVGSSGGVGLTTWRQVSRVQPIESGFTTWQRLRSGGGHATARSVNLVEWSKHGRHQEQTPTIGSDKMGRSGQLLRLYQSSRTCPSTHARQQTISDDRRFDQPVAKVSEVAGSCGRNQRTGRRTVARRTSADKCVQCLPSFRDRCVQTSSSALIRADKSLQTSTLSDQVMRSALLLSRPLPDLDFLRLCSSSSVAPRKAEVVEAMAGRRNSDGARSSGVPSSSLGDSGHGGSPAESGRSSSARRHHGSDSGLSNNSSSSSGIEPADSTTSHHRPADGDTSTSVGPRKPPRSFSVEPCAPDVTKRRHTDGELHPYFSPACNDDCRLTCCCDEASPVDVDNCRRTVNCRTITSDNFVLRGGALRRWQTTNCNVVDDEFTDDSDTNQAVCSRDFVASHPLCRRSPTRSTTCGRRKAAEGLVSPTRQREVEVSSRTMKSVRRRHVNSACHVHGHQSSHHHVQTSPAKPAKSILVRRRQRGKMKHRSWSDAHEIDAPLSSECCPGIDELDDAPPSPQPAASRVARPVSLPDATVLYAGLTDFTGHDTDLTDHRQCPADDTRDPVDDTDDGEQFRAKKSVSFSEKIFYHSMPSVSPLESPLCPHKLPPSAPECRLKVTASQPASELHTCGTLYLRQAFAIDLLNVM